MKPDLVESCSAIDFSDYTNNIIETGGRGNTLNDVTNLFYFFENARLLNPGKIPTKKRKRDEEYLSTVQRFWSPNEQKLFDEILYQKPAFRSLKKDNISKFLKIYTKVIKELGFKFEDRNLGSIKSRIHKFLKDHKNEYWLKVGQVKKNNSSYVVHDGQTIEFYDVVRKALEDLSIPPINDVSRTDLDMCQISDNSSRDLVISSTQNIEESSENQNIENSSVIGNLHLDQVINNNPEYNKNVDLLNEIDGKDLEIAQLENEIIKKNDEYLVNEAEIVSLREIVSNLENALSDFGKKKKNAINLLKELSSQMSLRNIN